MIHRGVIRKILQRPIRVQFNIEETGTRPPPATLSDRELLRVGLYEQYLHAQKASLNDRQRKALLIELEELREEWKRRFPGLPLSITLDEDDDETNEALQQTGELIEIQINKS